MKASRARARQVGQGRPYPDRAHEERKIGSGCESGLRVLWGASETGVML